MTHHTQTTHKGTALAPTPWYSVIAPTVIAVLHLSIGYLLVSQYCATGFPWFSLGSASGMQVLVVILSLVAWALLIVAGVSGYRHWHLRLDDGHPMPSQVEGRVRFMGLAGLLLSALFFLFVLFATAPVIFLNACIFL